MINHLVGGRPTPLKNDGVKVSWDNYKFPTEWKIIKFHGSKPPTSDLHTKKLSCSIAMATSHVSSISRIFPVPWRRLCSSRAASRAASSTQGAWIPSEWNF